MGGGGGKKDLARDSLFSALDSVCRAVPSGAMNVSGGILVRPPSVGGSETYLLAVQRSLSDALSSQFSQWSFFDDSMSLAYSLLRFGAGRGCHGQGGLSNGGSLSRVCSSFYGGLLGLVTTIFW